MAQEKIASHCHHHMVAEPLVADITARSGASELGRLVLDSCRGDSRVGCGKLVRALYFVVAILACVLPTVRSSMTEQTAAHRAGGRSRYHWGSAVNKSHDAACRQGMTSPLCQSSKVQENPEDLVTPVAMDTGPEPARSSSAKFIDQQLGHNRVTLRCDNELAIEALAREIAQASQEGSQTVPERPPEGESQSNGIIEPAVGLVAGQARTLKAALEHRRGARVPPDARTLCRLVEFAAKLLNRCDIGRDGKTPLQRLHGRRANTPNVEFGEKILYMPVSPARGVGAAIPPRSVRWYAELVVRGSGCHRAGPGDQDKVGEHQKSSRVGEMRR